MGRELTARNQPFLVPKISYTDHNALSLNYLCTPIIFSLLPLVFRSQCLLLHASNCDKDCDLRHFGNGILG